MVDQSSIDQLIEDSEQYNNINVISGYCNTGAAVDTTNNDSNISIGSLPPDPPVYGGYHQYHWDSLVTLDHICKTASKTNKIVQVLHQGFALTLLKREIVQRIPFRTSAGCCVDSCLSLDLNHQKIPQFVDLRCKSTHLKTNPDILLVGKRDKEIIFEPYQYE